MAELIRRDAEWQQMPGEFSLPIKLLEDDKTGGGPKRLCILGVDPGATTGASLITVPRASLFGDAKGKILSHQSWEITGTLRLQVRQVTSLALRAGAYAPTLVVCEDFDLGGNRLSGSASEAAVVSPVRVGAALRYAVESGHADKSVLVFQGRTLAFTTATDDRLKAWGIYDVGSDHKRDATRHAITMIRRISNGSVDAREIWT